MKWHQMKKELPYLNALCLCRSTVKRVCDNRLCYDYRVLIYYGEEDCWLDEDSVEKMPLEFVTEWISIGEIEGRLQ